ncbi:MAG TPA: tRNA epoxyqueuosine(34) reductase QueG [Lacunisphaera sp.]|nr:tRNA epoxyqueuosine(34) reductase QueG [Lacunisphaera sp.]
MTPPPGRPDPDAPREDLRGRLQALGFDEVRFASAGRGGAGLDPWLESGHQADMEWMHRSAAKRLDPALVLPGAQTVIALGINYAGADIEPVPDLPRWARYALHGDYHDSIKEGLARAGRILEAWGGLGPGDYRYYVDTGPVMERGWAARSGLGFRGKNGMLISRRHGNWLFLAAILTRARIAPDEPLRPREARVDGAEPAGLLCGTCTRCLDACPTAAFPRPGVVDSRRCISYHTIENRGLIPREFRQAIGDRVYGCDVCLEVCPWNRFAGAARRVLLGVRADLARLELAQLLALTPERFAALFKGTAVKRLKLAGLLRNACVVAGNTGDAAHVPALVRLAAHDSPVVRAHAVWAVRELAGGRAGPLLAEARAREADAAVLAEYGG